MKQASNRITLIVSMIISFAFLGAFATAAESAKESASSTMAKQLKGRLSTSMSFAGSSVNGQYQMPAEATVKIENEKPLEELLGLRTQFRDRIAVEEEHTSERK